MIATRTAYGANLTYSRCVKKPVITPGNVYSATYFGFTAASANSQNSGAQFIAVCSSAKTYEIGENLLFVSDPISRPEERLIHADALVQQLPENLSRKGCVPIRG